MMKILTPLIAVAAISLLAQASPSSGVPVSGTTARLFMNHGEFMEIVGTGEQFAALPAPMAKQILGFQLAAINLTLTICPPATEAKYNAEYIVNSLPKISEFASEHPTAPLISTSTEFWKQHRLSNGCIRSADTTYGVKVSDITTKYQVPNSKPIVTGFLFAIHDKMAVASCAETSPFQNETDVVKIDAWMKTLISGTFTPAILNTNAGMFFSYKLSQEIFKNRCGSITA